MSTLPLSSRSVAMTGLCCPRRSWMDLSVFRMVHKNRVISTAVRTPVCAKSVSWQQDSCRTHAGRRTCQASPAIKKGWRLAGTQRQQCRVSSSPTSSSSSSSSSSTPYHHHHQHHTIIINTNGIHNLVVAVVVMGQVAQQRDPELGGGCRRHGPGWRRRSDGAPPPAGNRGHVAVAVGSTLPWPSLFTLASTILQLLVVHQPPKVE
jgi:hypothetical protein